MTGINVRKGRPPPKDLSPAERYWELKQAPERYSIIQLGVALFHPVPTGVSQPESSPANENRERRGYTPVATAASSSASRNDALLPRYHVRRYNFYMFPDEREVVLNPSTVAFLHQHNLSLDLWSKQGIPYCTHTAQAQSLLESYTTREAPTAPTNVVPAVRRAGVELRRPEDIAFFARAMAGLREWLDSDAGQRRRRQQRRDDVDEDDAQDDDPADEEEEGEEEEEEDNAEGAMDGEGLSYLMPPCNSFLRRALYENIQAEYPALETEPAGNSQIRVWRLNEQERQNRLRRLKRERWEELIGTKLGVWRVFEALHRVCSGLELDRTSVLFAESYDEINWDIAGKGSTTTLSPARLQQTPKQRTVPLIVHNGFMDLCFLLSHFHSSILPENYQDCKDLISSYWPIIYDTKVIATECNCWAANGRESNPHTNLADLFRAVVRETNPPHGQQVLLLDQLEVVETTDPTNGMASLPDQEHEAAYDAYMTGACFLGLCKMIRQIATVSPNFLDVLANLNSQEARMFYGRNKLYQMSMYTMDLEESRHNRDPMRHGMLPETSYRVSGIDKAVSTRGECNWRWQWLIHMFRLSHDLCSSHTPDIIGCLSGLTDTENREINFEIVWIDDTTFLVAASFRGQIAVGDEMESILRDHGQSILAALRNRFSNGESIVLLESHLQMMEETRPNVRAPKETWFSRALAFLGVGGKKRANVPSTRDEQSNKRQRVS